MDMVDVGKADVVNFGGYRWWAERGLIHWEKLSDGEYGTMSVRSTLNRLRGLNEMVKNSLDSKSNAAMENAFGGGVEKHQSYIESMVQLCQKAREQGEPTSDEAVREANRRRPKTIVVPGLAGF